MKRLQIFILLLFISGSLCAQGVVVRREVEGDYLKITKTIPVWQKRHNFRFSIGSYSSVLDYYLSTDYYGNMSSFSDQVDSAGNYTTDRRFYGLYSLNYTYQPYRWFEVGGTLSFGATTQSRRQLETDAKIEDYNYYAVVVMPTVRFTYMNRGIVQLYSGISLGVAFGSKAPEFTGDCTLIGCSVGKKLFGFAELGAGVGGWSRVGIGYRFDIKGKK
ncbi:MAG: hypothetical protein IJX65_07910 [Alistipes sp.]|nr:hypothetical protein [Alistipes sp.]